MQKRALVTGVSGMDGSIMADYLLAKGYIVYGLIRRSSSPNLWRINHLLNESKFHLIDGDLTDQDSLYRAVEKAEPRAIYNLAAQSFVPYSWDAPVNTLAITGIGPVNLLEVIRNTDKSIKFYQASSSEMFGKVQQMPQTENTPFYPRSPYGVAKVTAHYATINYHESFGIHAASGILFNHEHERRGIQFVTRKVTNGIAKYFIDKENGTLPTPLQLGNLEAKRDWGYAEDYIDAMYRILNHPTPEAFVIATGITKTVRELCESAVKAVARELNLDSNTIEWRGSHENEAGYYCGQPLITISKEFYRPAEVDILLGDPSKAKLKLGWIPTTSFQEMINRMVAFDLTLVKKEENSFAVR